MEIQYKNLLFQILTEIHDLVFSEKTKEEARLKPQYFTRDRKLPFPIVLIFLLANFPGSLDSELQAFFSRFFPKIEPPSEAALSKTRGHLNSKPFKEMFEIVRDRFLEFKVKECPNGPAGDALDDFIVLAFDGSMVSLPNFKLLGKLYGFSGRGKSSPAARIELAFGSKDHFIYSAELAPLKKNERKLALDCLGELSRYTSLSRILAVFDRGYTGLGFIRALYKLKVPFLIRVRKKFHGVQELAYETVTRVHFPGTTPTTRVAKLILDPGNEETLVTSLKSEGLKELKEYYSQRWSVETEFYFLKHGLRLEDFNGYTQNSIQQDFWIDLTLSNIVSIIREGANISIYEKRIRKKKKNKYNYQTNLSEIVSTLHVLIAEALVTDDGKKRKQCIDRIFEKAERYVLPIRENRKVSRTQTRKASYHFNQKVH